MSESKLSHAAMSEAFREDAVGPDSSRLVITYDSSVSRAVEAVFDTIPANVEALERAIFSHSPILGSVLSHHKNDTLAVYAKTLGDIENVSDHEYLRRRQELIQVACKITEQRLGPAVAEKLEAQLRCLPLVSTT